MIGNCIEAYVIKSADDKYYLSNTYVYSWTKNINDAQIYTIEDVEDRIYLTTTLKRVSTALGMCKLVKVHITEIEEG